MLPGHGQPTLSSRKEGDAGGEGDRVQAGGLWQSEKTEERSCTGKNTTYSVEDVVEVNCHWRAKEQGPASRALSLAAAEAAPSRVLA